MPFPFRAQRIDLAQTRSYKERLEIFHISSHARSLRMLISPQPAVCIRGCDSPAAGTRIQLANSYRPPQSSGLRLLHVFCRFYGVQTYSYYMPRGFNRLYDANSLPDISRRRVGLGRKERNRERVARQIEERAKTRTSHFYLLSHGLSALPFDVMSNGPQNSPKDYLKGSWVGHFKNSLSIRMLKSQKSSSRLIKAG